MNYKEFSKKYDRIFAFGCSYTNYLWDTWADILKKDLEKTHVKFYNYGVPGSSNEGIARRVQEANLIHYYNDRDAILIVWSGWGREERIYKEGWRRSGSIFLSDKKFAKRYFSAEQEFVKNSIAIISTNKFLEKKLIFQGSMVNIYCESYSIDQKIINFFEPHLPIMHSFESSKEFLETYENSFDNHLTILSHLKFLESNFYKLTDDTKSYYYNYDQKIRELYKNNNTNIISNTKDKIIELSPKNRHVEEFYLNV